MAGLGGRLIPAGAKPEQGVWLGAGGYGHQKILPANRAVSNTYVLRGYINSCPCLGTLRGLDMPHTSVRRLLYRLAKDHCERGGSALQPQPWY